MKTKTPPPLNLLRPSFLMAGVYAVAILSTVVLISACAERPTAQATKPSLVKTAVAASSNAVQSWEYAGEIKPRYETTLSFRVPGKIQARLVNLGDTVTSSTVVARLDTADLKLAAAQANAAVEQATAQAKLAAEDFQRHRDLFSRDLIAKAELDRREAAAVTTAAQLNSLQAGAEQANNAARYGLLAAGNSGVVTGLMVEAGQVVAAGQPIMQIAQTDQIEASFAVPETQIRQFAAGQSVTVRVVDGEAQRSGKIREIAAMADPVSRTYSVRVKFTDISDKDTSALKLGMSALVTVKHNESTDATNTDKNVALVPFQAVVADAKTNYVLVIEKGLAVKRQVTMQQVSQGNLVSISGVKPGETIVAAGAQFVTPGTPVTAVQIKGAQS
jgi:membrane fusion protein, multidrug efflux system